MGFITGIFIDALFYSVAVRTTWRCLLTGFSLDKYHLERHQIETVQTVLKDPVQRYLLADEVGLETTEACLILKQYLFDHPEGLPVAIIVPKHLIDQWADELHHRFCLGDQVWR